MNMVEIRNLSRRFGENLAVDSLNLEIEKGEIFGLLGPNGAGKSTTINMIVGLLSPSKGEIRIGGLDVAKAKKRIGIVPQDLAIYEDLSARENVEFFAGLYGISGHELRTAADRALEFTGLSDKAKAAPKTFSGGMKRRLNIACAIAHKPDLIVMDEPTVGIDPQSRNHILDSVRTLRDGGCTVIYTSHYMEEVEELCRRVAIMDHGKVIADGSIDELVALITDESLVWIVLGEDLSESRVEELRRLPGVVNIEANERTMKVASARDSNNLDSLVRFFSEKKIAIKSVESKTPDLESVFLSLTGRSLRD